MTQSQLAISFMLSSKFPVEILEAKAFLYNGAGLELTAVLERTINNPVSESFAFHS